MVTRFRVLAPLENTWRHRVRVVAVVPEANGVVSIVMRGRHMSELRVEAGQFFRWRFLTAKTWRTAHPFSLSAVPVGDTFPITVKALGKGSRLIHAVRPGRWSSPRAVRGDDRPAADVSVCPAHRGRRGHHAHAGPV
jgi:NAD(P)H-flavin reductase